MKGNPAASLPLTKPELLASVASLYADHLKPFGRVLLKRLRERAAARHAAAHGLPEEAVDPEEMPRLNPRHLRKMCETCRQLRVVSEEGREFSVTLANESCEFLDVCSPADPYPDEFWQQLAEHLDLVGESIQLPGGRYACARAMMSSRLAFFQGYSLGQVCHIVQLAINCRRLLGYNREGWLVAYKHSEGWVKEQCACAQASTGQEMHPVVSWDEARAYLWQLLQQPTHKASGITLSNVKRLFRVHFERELSETALGHVRLLDLMKDPGLADVCTLTVQGNGQTTVTSVESYESISCPVVPPGMWAIPMEMCQVPMMPMMALPAYEHVETGMPEALVSPGSSPRGSPRESLCGAHSFATESTAEGIQESVSEKDDSETVASPFLLQLSDTEDEVEVVEASASPWSVSIKNTFIDVTSSPSSRQRRRSTPAISRARVAH